MESLQEKYAKVLQEITDVDAQINALQDNEKVKQYIAVCDQHDKLMHQKEDLYKSVLIERYSSCNHIWIIASHDYDSAEGRSYYYHGCIKCGLDRTVFRLMENCNDLQLLTPEQRVMYDFMYGHCLGGKMLNTSCDLELAKSIYAKIKEAHPDIDDETAIKYLKVALADIKKIKVNDERKKSRAKRLAYKPKYN